MAYHRGRGGSGAWFCETGEVPSPPQGIKHIPAYQLLAVGVNHLHSWNVVPLLPDAATDTRFSRDFLQ